MQHPDEGTIHAWLDGALGAEEARALEAHVAGCARCAAAVTEARGLLAASSRILSALDAVPGGVLPATEPGEGKDERVIPIGRSSLWRSPGWRAAAAIVLVGSVSWLATRSAQRGEGSLASPTRPVMAAAYDTVMLQGTAPAMADTLSQAGEQAAKKAGPPASSRAVKVAEPQAAPAQVAAAPRVIPYAMPRLVETPNAGAVGGGATAGARAPAAVAQAPVAQAPARGNAALREESRVADAELSARSSATAQAKMKSSAPGAASGALSRQEPVQSVDADVARLVGCYSLEIEPPGSSDPVIRSSRALMPARVELTIDRDTKLGPGRRVLRAAPGLPPIAPGTRASWAVLTADSVRLEFSDERTSINARIGVRGDSIHGGALITTPFVEGFMVRAGMRGSRMLCSSP